MSTSRIKPDDRNNAASIGDAAGQSISSFPLASACPPEASAAVGQPALSSKFGTLNGSKHGVSEPLDPDASCTQDIKRTKGIQDQVRHGMIVIT